MRRRILLSVIACATVLMMVFMIGCQRSRTDAQIAGDVQSRINADAAVQSRCLVQGQCTLQVSSGVVTLNGSVASDAERSAIASDAAQVEGVKTVVNNLQVAVPVTASAEPVSEPVVQPQPSAVERRSEKASRKPSGFRVPRRQAASYSLPASVQPVNIAPQASAVPVAPPAPPRPVEVTIPEGTRLSIRLMDPLDSERNQVGDHFRATLDSPVMVGDVVAIPAGADVYGRVTNAKSAGHFSGRSQLALELTRVGVNGRSYELHTDQYSRQGAARGKNTAAKVGTGAAIGAIIGGIAGGGKGAAIGSAIGAGAGTGAQAVTHGEQINLTSEQALAFHLESPLTVTAASRLERNSGRQRLDPEE